MNRLDGFITNFKQTVYIRFVLIGILTCILIHSFFGELIPYNGGLGWDGVAYYGITRDFHNLIMSHGIDKYYMSRFLPFAVIHSVLWICEIPVTVENALLGAKVLNCFSLILLTIYFFKLSALLKWNLKSEILAFSFVFFNYPVLKHFGYYPLGTDCVALLFSYAGIFYYFSHNLKGQIVIGLLSLVTFPIVSAVLLILALFPRDPVRPLEKEDKLSLIISKVLRFVFVCIPVMFFVLRIYLNRLNVPEMFVTTRGDSGPFIGCASLLSVVVFYYLSTLCLVANYRNLIIKIFNKRNCFKILIGIFFFYVLFECLRLVGGPTERHNLFLQFMGMYTYSQSDIFIFLETPFIYLGLFPLLVMLSWNSIFESVRKEFGIGYFVVMILFLIMLMDIETRKLVAFYPILLIPLINYIQTLNLKKQVILIIPFVCLLTSFFWFNINTPDINDAFEQPIATYVNFPAQRFFMFHGLWQSHSVYLVTILIEIFLGVLIYALYKKGMLTHRNV